MSVTTPQSPDVLPATDSATGWWVVAATFLATFTAFGVAYSFGSFFAPMADEFGSDRSATAFFFAITTFLYFALGVVTGRIADVKGPRPVLLTGSVFLVIGLLVTSRVQSITLGYLTYGVGVGIGVACAYVPMVAAVGAWFERQRTTALGVAVAGIGVGTLTWAPATEWLIDRYDWRQAYVILAVVAAGLMAIAVLGAHRPPPVPTAAAGAPLGTLLRTSRAFWVIYASMGIMSIGLFVPFVFLGDYMKTTDTSGSAGWLIGLIGIASVVGRLGLGTLARRFPTVLLYRGSFLVLGLSFLLWRAADGSYGVLVVFALVLGVAYGGFIALAPAVTAELFSAAGLGAILGALYTAAGVGGLLGPPIMGALIDRTGYDDTLLVAMASGLGAFVVLFALPRADEAEPEPAAAGE